MAAPAETRFLFSFIPISPLHQPPGQKLSEELPDTSPVVRQFARRSAVSFYGSAVIELVAIELNLVIRIDFHRFQFRFLLIRIPHPAFLPVPVLADPFAILELDLDVDRKDE